VSPFLVFGCFALALGLVTACDGGRIVRPGGQGGQRDATASPTDARESDDDAAMLAPGEDASAPHDGGVEGPRDAVIYDARPLGPGEDARVQVFADAAPVSFPDAAPMGFGDAAPIGFADAAPMGFADAAPVGFADAAPVGFADAQPNPAVRDAGTPQDAGTPACTVDSQCASGRCHPLYGQCVPPGQKLSCESCSSDSECGLPTDHCMDVSTSGGMYLETACAQGCRATADCPRGYDCTLNGHCYPIAGSIRLHTCASLRDMLAGETCNSFGGPDTCGLTNYGDGTCVPTVGCTVGCVDDQGCPSLSTCTFVIVDSYCIAQ